MRIGNYRPNSYLGRRAPWFAFFLVGGLAACGGGGAYVETEPPPLRYETRGVGPGVEYAWVPGYWAWNRSAYEWAPGHWAAPDRGRHVWVEGRWVQTRRGWHHINGRWR
jgi:WXXGXW repeat (2 copies)